VAVKDDVVAVRKNPLDLAMRIRMVGYDPVGEFPYTFNSVFDERVVLTIAWAGVGVERIVYIALHQSLLVEGDGIDFIGFGIDLIGVRSDRVGLGHDLFSSG
jgi:hypothetical protein